MAKKDKKKKGKGGGNPGMVDGIPTAEMTKEQLEEHIIRLQEEINREREERNYFQLERDKINTFWEITKRQLEEKKVELRNKDREMEDVEERHQVEIKVYKQKVKHLLYEHQNNLAEVKMQNLVEFKEKENSDFQNEVNDRKAIRDLKQKLHEDRISNEEVMKSMKLKQQEEQTALRSRFEQQVSEIEEKFNMKMKNLREDLELRRKTDIHEVEERKNQQINTLLKNHEKAFSDIKNYYNDITLNNLALINTLKEQVEEMKKKEERLEKQMHETQMENKRLVDPLNKAKDELTDMRKKVTCYEKDKQLLASTRNRLKLLTKEHSNLQWELEVLTQRYDALEKERDAYYKNFTEAIHDVQQKAGLKNLLLEKKLTTIGEMLEKRNAQFNEVVVTANLDPTAIGVVGSKLDEVVEKKNNIIKELQLELARICKSYNDLLRSFDAKLQQMGLSSSEHGFKPMATTVMEGNRVGTAPMPIQ